MPTFIYIRYCENHDDVVIATIVPNHPMVQLVAVDSIPSTTFLFHPSCGGKLVKELKQPGVVSDLSKQLHSGFVSEKSHIPWPAQLAGHIKLSSNRIEGSQ